MITSTEPGKPDTGLSLPVSRERRWERGAGTGQATTGCQATTARGARLQLSRSCFPWPGEWRDPILVQQPLPPARIKVSQLQEGSRDPTWGRGNEVFLPVRTGWEEEGLEDSRSTSPSQDSKAGLNSALKVRQKNCQAFLRSPLARASSGRPMSPLASVSRKANNPPRKAPASELAVLGNCLSSLCLKGQEQEVSEFRKGTVQSRMMGSF